MTRSTQNLKQSISAGQPGLSNQPFSQVARGAFKRAFDFMVALFGLILLFPFFGIIAILIKRDSPGPVFYWGPRIGRYGRQFGMLKFRTMYETPRSYRGPRVTSKEDDRITPLGKWLRDTKLNELPQLWNVLIGEMSLVGPRPEDPTISRTWPTKIASEILSMRPGITSPASVLYRDEESMLHAGEVMQKYLHELSPDKMRLDQLYVRYHSFWLDLDVILWTALLLVPKIKAYSPPERLLFVGPVTRLIQRYVTWILWDFAVVWLSIVFVSAAMRLFVPVEISWLLTTEMAAGCAALYSLTGLFLNVNRINWEKASTWELGRLWVSWTISTIAILYLHYFLGRGNLITYGLLMGASSISLLGIMFVRYRGRLISVALSRLLTYRLRKHETRERVLIVGSGRTAEHLAWLMDHPSYAGKFRIVGFIDDNLMSQGMKIYGSKVIGRVKDIQRIIRKRDIGLIILADNQMASNKYREFHDIASFSPARIVVAPDIFGSLSGLDGGSANSQADDHLNDFQCQHCLARYTSRQVQFQNIRVPDFQAAPLMKRIPQRQNGKKWKTSGQKRKSL
jgi:lipopolysaccharide/colanic/teichoic acid biosynthesis glycosyltransferase